MAMKKDLLNKVEAEAKKYFKNASGCHDWSHVERVRKMALHLGRLEGGNLKIIELAALLHDIGRKAEMKQKGIFCHAEAGAKTARKILKRYKLSAAEIDNIAHCIEAHRSRNRHIPQTIEAKVIFDADKLDSLGAIGVARIFLFAGNAGSNCLYTGNENRLAKSEINYSYTKEDSAILEYEIKLKYLKNKMQTKSGRAMALDRSRFMDDYFKRFWKEVGGKL